MDYLLEYQKLRDSLPRASLGAINNQNCDFCNYIDRSKDCYLAVDTLESERCLYVRRSFYSTDCIDCNFIEKCELCLGCTDCKNCYNCTFLQDCENSMDCDYCLNLKGCKNCVGCTNLRQKQYYIFNERYLKEEYAQRIKELTPEQIKQKFEEVKIMTPHQDAIGENNINSSGDHISNNKNINDCFESTESEDCGYGIELYKCRDCFDITIGEFSELNYDCVSSYHLNNSDFTYNCWESSDLIYCEQCRQCEHCMFSSNLLHKNYYILNKPYKKEEYLILRDKILAEMKVSGQYGLHISSTYPFEDSMAAC